MWGLSLGYFGVRAPDDVPGAAAQLRCVQGVGYGAQLPTCKKSDAVRQPSLVNASSHHGAVRLRFGQAVRSSWRLPRAGESDPQSYGRSRKGQIHFSLGGQGTFVTASASAPQSDSGQGARFLMQAIAPRRTGVVVFGAWIVSIFTGFLFITMVTHRLTTPQFGLLEVVTDIVAFATYPVRLISFWAARDTGRGKKIGKSAVFGNLAISVGGCGVFALFAFLGNSALVSSATLFSAALVLVPIAYWYRSANYILQVHHPQATAYTLLMSEGSKIAVGYVMIFALRLGLTGVLLSLAVSNVVQAVVGTYYIRDTMEGSLSLGQLKTWLGNGWLALFNSIPSVIANADTYVAFLVTGGYTLTGYYQGAFAIASMVGYSGFLSAALYPLLLRGAAEKVIANLFDLSMMVGIPMAVGVAALAPQFLYLLSRQYLISTVPLMILGFSELAQAFDLLLDKSLMGKDTSDLAERNKVKSLLKGDLFFVPMANLLYGGVYIGSVAVIAYVGIATGMPYQETITIWAIDELVVALAIAALKVRRLGLAAFAGTGRSLFNYSLCSAAMAAVVWLVAPHVLAFNMPTLYFGLRFLLVIGLGGIVYFAALAAIDTKARERIAQVPRLFLA